MPQGPQECTNPQRNYAGKGTQNLSRNIARKEIYLLFFEYQSGRLAFICIRSRRHTDSIGVAFLFVTDYEGSLVVR